MSIFDEKNVVDPLKRVPTESDKEHEAMLARIDGMSVEELWGAEKKKEESQLDIIMKVFPNSKIIEEKTAPNKALLSLLTPEVVPDIKKDVETPQGLADEAKLDVKSEALRLVTMGRSVIPVGLNKRPMIAWQEFQKRLPTKEEIEKWFTQWPEAQLAMVTGNISNVCVVDVEKEFGDYKTLGLPDTAVSKTGGGGWHLFYQYVEGVRNRAKLDGKDVDIRGEGGYVLIPPSSKFNALD